MLKLRNSLLALLTLSVIIGVVAAILPRTTQGQNPNEAAIRPVQVVNTAAHPVPISGNTTISGAISLAQGTTVGISGLPNVIVGNSESSPVLTRDVDSARQPYQNKLCGGSIGSGCAPNPELTVPAGKRLVIESYSVSAIGSVGTKIPLALLGTEVNGIGVLHTVTPTFIASVAGSDYFSAHQQTRIYCDPGTTIGFVPVISGSATVGFSFSGYLVDVP